MNEHRINLIFGNDGKVRIKCTDEVMPISVVEEVVNSAVHAYSQHCDQGQEIKSLKHWNIALSIALIVMTIANFVR